MLNKLFNLKVILMTFIKKTGLLMFVFILLLNYQLPSYSQSKGLKLVSERSTSDNYYRYITGVVKNESSKTYSIVTISYSLYDRSGSLVGNAVDTIQNFRPGATWKFKAMILEDSAVKFELDSIDGY
jgi:hypothetical protein